MATTGRAVKTVLIPPPRARVVALLTRQLVAQSLCVMVKMPPVLMHRP